MKLKRKTKLSSSSSSSSSSSCKDPDSLLKLLPVTVLSLAISLPTQDREVLAYLISTSLFTNKTKCRNNVGVDKVAVFECGCFDCYTWFWSRWDSSPNRELIHQVIEEFEDHLVKNESLKINNNKSKRRHKEKDKEKVKAAVSVESFKVVAVEDGDDDKEVVCDAEREGMSEWKHHHHHQHQQQQQQQQYGLRNEYSQHKCMARKVLPDVVGLLNARLWSLWSPGL